MKSVTKLLLLTILISCSHLQAELRLPSVLSDNMVLQRDKVVRIWGKADPGSAITVDFAGQKKTVKTNPFGEWSILLAPMPASAKPQTMTISSDMDNQTIGLSNILVGDVWICGGQSNMQFQLFRSANAAEATKRPANDQIRYFYQQFNGFPEPQPDCTNGKWTPDNPETRQQVSAVAWYFIQEIYKSEQVPVALLQANQGGSSAQMWTPLEDLKNAAEFWPYLDEYRKKTRIFNERKQRYQQNKASGKKMSIVDHYGWFPVAAYNAMIHPIQNFSVKGVIWYQGEANSSSDDAKIYRKLFPAMIQGWRREFNDPALPFLFVQLPNFGGKPVRDWAALREAQTLTLKETDHIGMAVTIDIGESDNIHPTRKKPVGERLAKIALKQVYGKPVECSAPSVQKAEMIGNTIVLHFDAPVVSIDDAPLREFTICGPDGQFVSAKAEIEGLKLIVSSAKISFPVAVRYAWRNDPQVNLFGQNGFPVAPFRTDR